MPGRELGGQNDLEVIDANSLRIALNGHGTAGSNGVLGVNTAENRFFTSICINYAHFADEDTKGPFQNLPAAERLRGSRGSDTSPLG